MILELLSPLATLHPAHFLAAVGVAWADSAPRRGVLVELLSSLRMFPTSTLIATLRQVIKSPPAIAGKHQRYGSGVFLTAGSGMGKKSGMNNPYGIIFPRAWKQFLGSNTKNFFMRIRDLGWKKIGSGIEKIRIRTLLSTPLLFT
jgi:hypothetical protein